MNKKISYISALFIILLGLGVWANSDNVKYTAVPTAPPAQTAPVTQDNSSAQTKNSTNKKPVLNTTNPLAVVQKPSLYLNKNVTFVARFNKFTALGLDYKPAYRSSETYISFLIFRPDTDKNIPLPELKLFITRKTAEKLIDLKEGDMIKFNGTVFSTALGDAWVDVDSISKLASESKQK